MILNCCLFNEDNLTLPEKNSDLNVQKQKRLTTKGNLLNNDYVLAESGWSNINLKTINRPYQTWTSYYGLKKLFFLRYKQFYTETISSGDWLIRIGGFHYGYFGKIFIDLINIRTKEFGYDEYWLHFWQGFPFSNDKMAENIHFKNSSGQSIDIKSSADGKERYVKIKSQILKLSGDLTFYKHPAFPENGHLHIEPADSLRKYWTKIWTQCNLKVKGVLNFDGRKIDINEMNKSMYFIYHLKAFWENKSYYFLAHGCGQLSDARRVYFRFGDFLNENQDKDSQDYFVFIDDRLIKLEPVEFVTPDRPARMDQITFTTFNIDQFESRKVKLIFTPLEDRSVDETTLGIGDMYERVTWGTWDGWIVDDLCNKININNLKGNLDLFYANF